jgi:hypothetical protein
MNLAGIEVTKSIAAAGLKITPDILVGGGGGSDGTNNVFSAFIAQMLAEGRLPNGNGRNGNGST